MMSCDIITYYLKKENPDLKIAIFDKDDHIGGKCYSYIDGQGRAHNMGSIVEVANYHVISELIDIADVERAPLMPIKDSDNTASETSEFGVWKSLKAVWKYTRLCNAHKVTDHWNFTNFSDDPIRMMPLDQLIREHQLEPLERFFNQGLWLWAIRSNFIWSCL